MAVVLLLQGPRTPHFATCLCGFYANGAAPTGLLLRARQRGIHARSERGDCAAPKKLFDARYRHAYPACAASVAHALTRHGGRSSATPNDSPPNTDCVLVLTGVRPPFAVPFRSLLFPRIGPNLTAGRPCHYALCVKDLAKRPKWASFEPFRFCIVDSTERRAE